MIKGSIQEEDITIINTYAPNIGALQYVRQTLTNMKEEINSNTIIVGDFNIMAVKRDKDGHYIMIKGSIQEEDRTIINIYRHPT